MGGAVHVLVLAGPNGPEEQKERHHPHGDGDRDEYDQSHCGCPGSCLPGNNGTGVWLLEVGG
jgi:hypothetical protein